MAVLALIAFFAFANSLGGEFVYDDNRQILMNPTIQHSSLYGKALTSDVWRFKGNGDISASNYYRPVFVFWLIVNFAIFGANPFGWHLLNVAIHIVVCLLVFDLLKRLSFDTMLSLLLAAIFAVHPVHVESVSWISGSPDILLSLFFLASLLLNLRKGDKHDQFAYLTSIVLYALALGTKEIAMLLFPIYFLIFRFKTDLDLVGRTDGRIQFAMLRTIPYAILAVSFFIVRWYVVSGVTHPVEDAPLLGQSLLSIPSVFLFYLRQTIFPISLTENYQLRPETGFTINFALSTFTSIAIAALIWWLCRKSKIRQLGCLIYILPLLPVLYVGAFPFEQIVHDRYLYLPLLGFLIVCGSLFADALSARAIMQRLVATVTVLIIVLLGLQTVQYNRVWSSNRSLWEYSVNADPNSASSFAYYASELSSRGLYGEAISAYDRSLEIKESPLALMGRSRNLISLGRYDEAIDNAGKVIQLPNDEVNAYTLYQAYEAAAVAYSSSGRSSDAEAVVRSARDRLPIYRAALTDKLAIILYNQGKKDEALNELNAARELARREMLPASKSVFLRAGMLEAETGNKDAAKRDLREYLNLSSTFSDNESVSLRRQAATVLAQLR